MDMLRSRFVALACMTAALLVTACANPNAIGVQDNGTIVGRVYDARTNQPLNGAIVSVGSLTTAHSGPDGSFTLTQVPTGEQTLIVYALPGYLAPAPVQVLVQSNQTTAAPPIGLTPG
jgi:uncharacterized membrane protein